MWHAHCDNGHRLVVCDQIVHEAHLWRVVEPLNLNSAQTSNGGVKRTIGAHVDVRASLANHATVSVDVDGRGLTNTCEVDQARRELQIGVADVGKHRLKQHRRVVPAARLKALREKIAVTAAPLMLAPVRVNMQ